MADILIDEEILNEIKTIIGFPLVQIEDTEIENDENLKQLVVYSALREYFIRFPVTYSQDYMIGNGNFTLTADVSIENIFNAVCKLNSSTGYALNPNGLYNQNNFSISKNVTIGSSNAYIGGVGDYDLTSATYMKRVEGNSITNSYKSFRYDFDRKTKNKVTGYSNTQGKVEVQWMCYSYDVNDVMYELQSTFIKYCQGLLLQNLAMIRGQMSSGQSSEFNNDFYVSKSKELLDEANDRYKGTIINPVVIKL